MGARSMPAIADHAVGKHAGRSLTLGARSCKDSRRERLHNSCLSNLACPHWQEAEAGALDHGGTVRDWRPGMRRLSGLGVAKYLCAEPTV